MERYTWLQLDCHMSPCINKVWMSSPSQQDQALDHLASALTDQVLVVGGGGGGGYDGGGGGGGGGVIFNSSYPVVAGTNYSIWVGGGGVGAPSDYLSNGADGHFSRFDTLIALGGGGGMDGHAKNTTASPGSSGGGGGYCGPEADCSKVVAPGSGTPGQGYPGGTAYVGDAGGGGGGAGVRGGSAAKYQGEDDDEDNWPATEAHASIVV